MVYNREAHAATAASHPAYVTRHGFYGIQDIGWRILKRKPAR